MHHDTQRPVSVAPRMFVVAAVALFMIMIGTASCYSAPPSTGRPGARTSDAVSSMPGSEIPGESVVPSRNPSTQDKTPPGGTPQPEPSNTRSRQDEIDDLVKSLREGELVFRGPNPMRVNEWQVVLVRVAESTPPTSDLPGSGPPQTRRVRVGTNLIARLSGPDFEIDPVGNDDGERVLPSTGFAQWEWDVRPRRSGDLYLTISLYVLVDEGGPPLEVRTFRERVNVEVNPGYSMGHWLKDYWAATGITVPVVVAAVFFLVRRYRGHTGRQQNIPPVPQEHKQGQ